MSSQICLKWNSFLSNIATSFESLWEEEGLVDVTLASDGQCLTAHKVILSASSPFFKKVFQTNPCRHPVVILQDVHFTELEALLVFIYKGEVNIEQKNLPALLKAAETLQIRGLSGGDIFAKESYKRLIESEQGIAEDDNVVRSNDEAPKKKQKVAKPQNNSILEKALTPAVSRPSSVGESSSGDACPKDADESPSDVVDQVPNPVYHRLDMKIEQFEVTVDDLQKNSDLKDELQRLDTGQDDEPPAVAKDLRIRSHWEPAMEPLEVRRDVYNIGITSGLTTSSTECEGTNGKQLQSDYSEPLNYKSDLNPGTSSTAFPSRSGTGNNDFTEENPSATTATTTTTTTPPTGYEMYPPYPCPFCDRAYTSWGFRRRHIKAVHTISPKLNCKWCSQVLPTHAAWRRHVTTSHHLTPSDAHNGLLILEEAHMVLQIARPTRLDSVVNMIKNNSQQNAVNDSPPPSD